MAKIREVIEVLEQWAPPALQENYDNSGLLTGDSSRELTGILITLDVTEPVIEEAVRANCNMIIAHHPIIFKGLKKLTGSNYVERTVEKAILSGISIYALHTNLDNVLHGVNQKIANLLGLQNLQIMAPKAHTLSKLITFVPVSHTDSVMAALGNSGAGIIGDYRNCSFQTPGTGTFQPEENANPFIGHRGKLEQVEEIKLEMVFPSHAVHRVIQALNAAHPYEEVAFDIIKLEFPHPEMGAGLHGELSEKLSANDFLHHVKNSLNLPLVRYSGKSKGNIQSVGVCGGSGSFLLSTAKTKRLDAFITADVKYHDFFDAEERILFADIGHYESEVFTKDLIKEYISQKFPNIALRLSKVVTNPVNYFS
jgi:dinuclear metal center YbgI/SA1388 family protein